MKASIINSDGRVLQMLELSNESYSNFQTREGTFLLGLQPSDLSDYWDGSRFVGVGEPPSQSHYFDYALKQWVDPRPLDSIKAQKWAEIKSQRNQLEFGGFEFEGGVFDSDQVSQGRILGAATAGIDQVWTLKNNATVLLTAAQLQQLYQALQLHIAEVHARGRAARQAIYEADTREKVDAVTL